MADTRDNENQDEPRIKIVDSRMLSDDERAGKGSESAEVETERPKLEIIGGGSHKSEAESNAGSTPEPEDALELNEEDDLSPEEREQMREQVENEQFAALEQQMGRPLTPQEKEQVREEMKKQAESISRLEVEPILVQLMSEMSARAAVHLGLMPNPYTRLVARNDTQARLAIDTFGAVYEVAKSQLDSSMRQELERVLNDLRVNFSSITGTPATNFPGSGGFGGPRIIH